VVASGSGAVVRALAYTRCSAVEEIGTE